MITSNPNSTFIGSLLLSLKNSGNSEVVIVGGSKFSSIKSVKFVIRCRKGVSFFGISVLSKCMYLKFGRYVPVPPHVSLIAHFFEVI